MLLEKLLLEGAIRTKRVKTAFERVDRKKFVPPAYKDFAYLDTPVPISFDQTISAPHIVAVMTEYLRVKPGNTILEVGAGSGYQSAILLHLLKGKGNLYALERIKELAKMARKNLTTQPYQNVSVITGDGSKGLEKHAPFDRIIVCASAKKVPPKLIQQLAVGGILVMPLGNELKVYTKHAKKDIHEKTVGFVSFVPLVEKE
ncbi:protein-L-isoaspartate O-methyltransferase [archaeon CG10_big_fil_rev_8_21_14_0_10_43_11]|nr:MAG: protein-L-isoaspartate O-methyltransferase [archaeon CG10_big_fil_rev_8_21_14_0_10_43_11]